MAVPTEDDQRKAVEPAGVPHSRSTPRSCTWWALHPNVGLVTETRLPNRHTPAHGRDSTHTSSTRDRLPCYACIVAACPQPTPNSSCPGLGYLAGAIRGGHLVCFRVGHAVPPSSSHGTADRTHEKVRGLRKVKVRDEVTQEPWNQLMLEY